MTGNELLDYLLKLDDDTSICELLELIRSNKENVIELVNKSNPSIDFNDKDLVIRVIKICTILEFKIGKLSLAVYRAFCGNPNGDDILPSCLFDERLHLDKPLFVGKHLDEFTRARMFLLAPQAFLNRNVYFDLNGLERF